MTGTQLLTANYISGINYCPQNYPLDGSEGTGGLPIEPLVYYNTTIPNPPNYTDPDYPVTVGKEILEIKCSPTYPIKSEQHFQIILKRSLIN